MENMTAKVSCFSRAYHHKNNRTHIFNDDVAEVLLGEDYAKIAENMTDGMLGDFNIYNSKSAKATLVAWLIVCVGEAVLAKFAEVYFRNELAAGTPFTQAGARERKRLGILMMAVPTGCVVVAEIVQGIIAGFMNVAADSCMDLNFDNEASVVLGVMFIVCSFLCGYGAEMLEGKGRKHGNTL